MEQRQIKRVLVSLLLLVGGIILMVLAARGRLGSGIAALLVPQNMKEGS